MIDDLRFKIQWEMRVLHERIYIFGGLWMARHLPRWLRYWVTIDSIAKATTGKYGTTNPTTLGAMEVLNRI